MGSETPRPSLRTTGPQDWSFGGEAKTSCVVPPPHGAKAPSPNGTWVSPMSHKLGSSKAVWSADSWFQESLTEEGVGKESGAAAAAPPGLDTRIIRLSLTQDVERPRDVVPVLDARDDVLRGHDGKARV